jgi:ubiquinone/menaquinone biosynthesis C-methylase UbiE
MRKDLSENSNSYHQEADIYQQFSDAEDYPNLIYNQLLIHIKNKIVLDLGCGNGKYLNLFSNEAQTIIGIDKSYEQLKNAKKHNNVNIIQADARKIPFPNYTFDVVFSCWMLGTISDDMSRLEIIKEMKRILKPDGIILLIENEQGDEFEEIRGRNNDPLQRTKIYNEWLLNQGFIIEKHVQTYFQFNNIEQANQVFKLIWGDKIKTKINTVTINHPVLILKNQKK